MWPTASTPRYSCVSTLTRRPPSTATSFVDGLSGVPGADELLRDLIRYADARGYWTDALEGRFLLGALLLRRGANEEARRELEETRRMADSYGYRLIAEDAREALEQIPG